MVFRNDFRCGSKTFVFRLNLNDVEFCECSCVDLCANCAHVSVRVSCGTKTHLTEGETLKGFRYTLPQGAQLIAIPEFIILVVVFGVGRLHVPIKLYK